MTEQEWLASEDPARMMRHLREWPTGDDSGGRDFHRHLPSDRKLRLWVQACRIVSDAASGLPHSRWADLNYSGVLEAAIGTWTDRTQTCVPQTTIADAIRDIVGNPFRAVAVDPAWLTPDVLAVAHGCYDERTRPCEDCGGSGKCKRYLGHGDYDEPDCVPCEGTGTIDDGTLDPARLAVLSDALEEAGAEDAHCVHCVGGVWGEYQTGEPIACSCIHHRILAHLRSPEPHYRGCWPLDLVLGRGWR